MLKRMLIILGVIGMLSTSALAAEKMNYSIADYATGRISVFGSVSGPVDNGFIGLTVLKPGVSADEIPDITSENNYIEYQRQAFLNNGSYSMYFKLSPLSSEEPYTLMVSLNGTAYTMPLYYYSKADIDSYIVQLNAMSAENMTQAELAQACEKLAVYLSLNSNELYETYFKNLTDKAEIMSIFLNSKGTGLKKDTVKDEKDKDKEKDIEGDCYVSIKKLFNQAIICAAYNHKLTGGKLAYDQYLGLNEDAYSYNLVRTAMTDTGVQTMVGFMTGNTSLEDLKTNFKKQSIFAAISHPTSYGYGHVTTVLSHAAAAETLEKVGFNKSVYEASDKQAVAKKVFDNPKSDLTALISYVNELSAANPKPIAPPPGGGSGSGGSGKNPSTPAPNPPIINSDSNQVTYEEVFDDLGGVEWAKRSIMALYKSGAISGYAERTFAPMDNITREQFVKILVAAMNIPMSEEEITFADVDEEQWYAPYVAAAVKRGITYGISETEFGVGEYITREQIAAMCSRVMTRTSDLVIGDFIDKEEISEYAYESVMLMKRLGIINGNDLGEFKPKSYATRAEVAQIVYGIVNLQG